MAILLVEQFLDFALRLADAFYVMEKGERSSPKAVIDHTTEDAVQTRHMTAL